MIIKILSETNRNNNYREYFDTLKVLIHNKMHLIPCDFLRNDYLEFINQILPHFNSKKALIK